MSEEYPFRRLGTVPLFAGIEFMTKVREYDLQGFYHPQISTTNVRYVDLFLTKTDGHPEKLATAFFDGWLSALGGADGFRFVDSWICTVGGKHPDLMNPKCDQICPKDIIKALSQINRFTGHTTRPYSVLEHMMIGFHHLVNEYNCEDQDTIRHWLLHDASEYVLTDISSPLKACLPQYRMLEELWSRTILDRFGVTSTPPEVIKEIDLRMLATEKEHLMPQEDQPWMILEGVKPFQQPIKTFIHDEGAARRDLQSFASGIFGAQGLS